MRRLDILSIGEAMVDLISDTQQESLAESHTFTMYPGGAAMNVALNAARLGGAAALVSCVGHDAFGAYIRQHLAIAGVESMYVSESPHVPTTLSVVTRQTSQPDFAVYRGADTELSPASMPLDRLSSISLVHTSAFALSREPARSSVLDFIEQAHTAGCMISFDPNYHPRLWASDADPLPIFKTIYPYVSITKPSLDDCARLFGADESPETCATHFLEMGAQQVVLTMGAFGALLANADGFAFFPTPPMEVVDVTGAGDSFWSGLLLATLDGYEIDDAILVAQAVAAIKLQRVGPLSHHVDRHALYAQLGLHKVGNT